MKDYFYTDNPALACTLALCGVPAPETPRGPFPILMLYTLEHLRSFGFSGMSAFDAAHRARKEKRIGTRVFQFQRTETLEKIVNAWKLAAREYEAGGPMELPNLNPEDVAKCAYFFNEFRRVFLTNFDVPTYLAFSGDSTTERKMLEANGRKTGQLDISITRGSFSAVSIDAPEEVRRQIRT